MIEVINLRHAYGPKAVLEDVSFFVPPGSVAGLVGPNGAGKTTLMRAVVGMLEPAGGRVRVADRDARSDERGLRAVAGYLPERTVPYPDLLVWEYLDLFADIAGHEPKERSRRVGQAIEAAGLHGRADTPTRELSKGLRQRLCLQGALMHDPKALVLDEPTDGLDPASRDLFLREVRALADGGRAVLLSSHVLPEIEDVADDVLILVGGRLSDEGKAQEVPRFRVRVRGDRERARLVLRSRPEVQAVVEEDGALVVELFPGTEDASAAAAALVEAGVALVELRRETETLRRRFARAVDRARRADDKEAPRT